MAMLILAPLIIWTSISYGGLGVGSGQEPSPDVGPPGTDNKSGHERIATYIISINNNVTLANGSNLGDLDISSKDAASVFQRVIDEVTERGGTVFIKPGNYYLNDTLFINGPISLVGSGTGYYNGSLNYGSALIFSNVEDGITVNMRNVSYETGLLMRDLSIIGSESSAVGVNMVKASRCAFYNVFVYGFTNYGAWLQEAHMNSFRDCRFINNGNESPTTGGVRIGYDSPSNVNNFWGCTFEFGASGAVIMNSYSCLFDGCTFESNRFHGVYGYSNSSLDNYAQHITITNAYFELNNAAMVEGPICDIILEGPGTSYWKIENIKTAGTMVNYSVMAQGWFTHLKNVRSLERTVFWASPYGSIEFVGNIDDDCLPIGSMVTKIGPNLVAEGVVSIAPNQTTALVNTGLLGKAANIQITPESECWVEFWISDNEAGQFCINLKECPPSTVYMHWRVSI